jgi:hypothetical protein
VKPQVVQTDFEKGFALCAGKTIPIQIQRILVPWLIAISGLQFKSTPMPIVREMLMAIIDTNGWLGDVVTCAEEAKHFPLAFQVADLVKKAKNAAGIFLSVILEHGMLLIRRPKRRYKFASTSLHRASCPPTAL